MERAAIYALSSVIAVATIIVAWIASTNVEHPLPPTIDLTIDNTHMLKKFYSHAELRKFLLETGERNRQNIGFYGGPPGRTILEAEKPSFAAPAAPTAKETYSGIADFDFSTTNVQVSNVDEPDFLKNDGEYVYILSNNKLTIIDAYPAKTAKVILRAGLDIQGQTFQNMFLNKDRLIIFYQSYGEDYSIEEYGYLPTPVNSPKTHALILDISDRENPKTVKNYEVTGNYLTARMMGDYVYFIANNPIDYRQPVIPRVMESSKTIMTPEVYYFDSSEDYYAFNTIAALDIFGGNINAETFMIGSASTVYVSEGSVYITYTQNLPYPYYTTNSKDKFFNVIVPLLPEDVQEKIKSIEGSKMDPDEKWSKISELLQDTYNRMPANEKNELFSEIQKAMQNYESRLLQETQRTVIHKIAMDRLVLKYSSKAGVPGHLLNQFSMDEYKGKFRMATTSQLYTPRGTVMHNNVYVLDENLKLVGSLDKIAPNEKIYSARFMSDKLYLVTFRQVDPFFVIDLSTDMPKMLGYLKIPGYSSYLHPYDENHIIGVGKDTKENQWGGVQTLGVKIALFDVSDVTKPVAIDVFTIGDQGTDSEVLQDHKAFLFDSKKDVLSIPIQWYNFMVERHNTNEKYYQGWRGFYVFSISPDYGIKLKAKVDHSVSYEDYGYGSRSFYIGDVLYTVTQNLMKMNDLKDMREINEIKLINTGEIVKYLD